MIFGTRSDLSSEDASILVYTVEDQILEDPIHSRVGDEIILVTKGHGTYQIGPEGGEINPGFIGYVRSRALRSWNSESRNGSLIPISAFVIHIPENLLAGSFLQLAEASVVKSFLESLGVGGVVRAYNFERVQARVRTIVGSRGMLRIARTHALLNLLSQIEDWQVIDDKGEKELGRRDQVRLKRVYDFLDIHFRGSVRRDALARLVEMEPNSFSRFFRRSSGQSLSDYLSVIRVRHAATLLGARHRTPISQIARESGFSNQSAFNRQFRMRLGVTPREYRKRLDLEWLQP